MSGVANQYGIDMGNILSTVSSLKTADQNREINTLRKDALSRKATKEIATDKAEQDYLKDPKTAFATTIAQQIGWDNLDKEKRANASAVLKERINQRGVLVNGIIQIQDPVQQKAAIQDAVSKLTPEDQQEYTMKYGTTPDEWQANLPKTMNDLIVSYGGIDLLSKQAEAKTKHEGDLELWGVKGQNALELQGAKGETEKEVQEMKGKNAITVAGIRASVAKYKADNPTTSAKMTEGQRNVAAVMAANPGMSENEARFAILQASRTTNVDDPIYGKKTITSSKTLPTNALRPPPPMTNQSKTQPKGATYKPSEVVSYGTSASGKKIAKMKDGSVIYVK